MLLSALVLYCKNLQRSIDIAHRSVILKSMYCLETADDFSSCRQDQPRPTLDLGERKEREGREKRDSQLHLHFLAPTPSPRTFVNQHGIVVGFLALKQ